MKDLPMNLRNALTVSAILVFSAFAAVAQETISQEAPIKPEAPVTIVRQAVRAFSIGLTGAYGIMLNSADQFSLPTVPTCCPGYSSTSGGGFIGGVELNLPLSDKLDLVARLVFQSSSSTFVTDEPTTLRVGNQAIETAFRHTLETQASFLMLEPMLDYQITGGISLIGGLRLGTSVGGSYDQRETFADPTLPYDFTGGASVRNASSGDLPNQSSFQMGLVLGARYQLPLNVAGTMSLVPEITFSPMFTNVVSDATWKISPIRLGLSVLFDVMRFEQQASPLSP